MAKILKIYSYKDPILRTRCRDIEHIDLRIVELSDDMWMTMLSAKAVGLAANQVGFDYNMITINGSQFQGLMINPVIEDELKEVYPYQEGCLSIPGYRMYTGKRFSRITVSYLDISGMKQTVTLTEETAVIVQHEIDHLMGVLMTDYMNKSLLS